MHVRIILSVAILLIGCQDQPPKAPFSASAPTTVVVTPDKPIKKVLSAGQKGHIIGNDTYPCAKPQCKIASPADGTLSTSGGGAKTIDPGLISETAGDYISMTLNFGTMSGSPSPSRR